MTVSEWIKKNKNRYAYQELTIADENRVIILDDKLCYLSSRSADYNKEWKEKCRGKQIVSATRTAKGVLLIVG